MRVCHFLVWGCFYPTQTFASSTFPLRRAHKGRKYVLLRKQHFANLVWTNILTDHQSESRLTNVGRNLFKFLSYSIFGQSRKHGPQKCFWFHIPSMSLSLWHPQEQCISTWGWQPHSGSNDLFTGVAYTIYIMIQSSSKITLILSSNESNFMAGDHPDMRNYIKRS